MDEVKAQLAHSLKVKFGTAPHEPTPQQLDTIIDNISFIALFGTPSEADWEKSVSTYCPTAGTWKYAGIDNSDLNALLVQAKQQASSS